jgi:hypothetical protein
MLVLVKNHTSVGASRLDFVVVPYTRASAVREDSAVTDVEELRRSVSSNRAFSAAAASSSNFFFLNRVSAMGRKNVQSNPYCLQCWHKAGSDSGKTSHLFDGGWVSMRVETEV